MELLRLDRTRYRRWDPIVYDVKVTNTSSQVLLLPISASPIAHRDRPAVGYRSALFTLVLAAAAGRDVRLDTYGLYGAPANARSVRALRPGESVAFRFPATLRVSDAAEWPDEGLPMPTSVRARVEMIALAYSEPRTATHQHSVASAPLESPIEVVNPAVMPLAPYREGPVLQAIFPPRGSPGCEIHLVGLRFGVDRRPRPSVSFISANGDVQRLVRNGGSGYGHDRSGDAQSLSVSVPPDLAPGTWHVVIDRDGSRSAPMPLEVGEWAGPIMERLSRTTVNPGMYLQITGSNFREGDTLELVDARGVVHKVLSGASCDSRAFDVPLTVAPGEATLQLKATGPRGDVVSQKLSLMVSAIPLPLNWVVRYMRSVAPGQWTRLSLSDQPAYGWWERIDVEFDQRNRTHVVEMRPSDEQRLRVPSDLHSGVAVLRARVVRGTDASSWSAPQQYVIASQPVPPTFSHIDVGATHQTVYLSPGPDRPAEFVAEPGDELLIGGDYPMSIDVSVPVTFENAAARRRVVASRDPVGRLLVHAPADLPAGLWKIVVTARGLPSVELPISMRVRPR